MEILKLGGILAIAEADLACGDGIVPWQKPDGCGFEWSEDG
jgi:hypothetical protein